MNSELEAIKDAWSKETGNGREEERTRKMCDAYIEAHPEIAEELQDWTIEQCANAVSVFRAAGFEQKQWEVEVWLLHHFEPQQIGGKVEARVRLPGSRA